MPLGPGNLDRLTANHGHWGAWLGLMAPCLCRWSQPRSQAGQLWRREGLPGAKGLAGRTRLV